jgi:acyl dehydratase
VPLDPADHLGRRYVGPPTLIRAADIEAYAAATDDNSVVYYGPDAVAPPMFHVRPLRDMLFAVMEDPALGLDMPRLVHAGHDVRLLRRIHPGEALVPRARLTGIDQKEKGVLVAATLQGWVEGALAVEAATRFFVRGQRLLAENGAHGVIPDLGWAPPEGEPKLQKSVQVKPDQSLRYAEASLDHNPIHLDPAAARAGGLPDVILHGLCTMALSGRALVAALLGQDSRGLRRLAVRWSRPVHNGQRLRVLGWPEARRCRFIVEDDEQRPVISQGIAEWA